MHDLKDLASDVVSRLSPATFTGALLYLLLFIGLAAVLSRALRGAVQLAMHRHDHLDRTTISFLQQFGSALIWVAALILYAHLVPVLRAMGTALLAGASIASVVIGLAAQSTLGNLVAGVAITLYRPFRLGDTLQVATPTGTEVGVVSAISLGYTVVRTSDDREVVLPNNLAASQVTLNLTHRAAAIAPIEIRLPRAVDIEAARSQILAIAREALGDAVVGCAVSKVDSKESVLQLRCEVPQAATAEQTRSDLIARIATRLHEQGPPGSDQAALG